MRVEGFEQEMLALDMKANQFLMLRLFSVQSGEGLSKGMLRGCTQIVRLTTRITVISPYLKTWKND